MSSNVALMGLAAIATPAAKDGIAAITRSLAVAYAPQRVRVNAICAISDDDRAGQETGRRKRRANPTCGLASALA
jgi:NAD(P)-dependent dehydrogenase (short-subunit alcohol dehydrogenase family)